MGKKYNKPYAKMNNAEKYEVEIAKMMRRYRDANRKGLYVEISPQMEKLLTNRPKQVRKEHLEKIKKENLRNWRKQERVINMTREDADLQGLIDYIENYEGQFRYAKKHDDEVSNRKDILLDYLRDRIEQDGIAAVNEKIGDGLILKNYAAGYIEASKDYAVNGYFNEFAEIIKGSPLTLQEKLDAMHISDAEEQGVDDDADNG